jgi:hypothetical protein
LVLAFDKQTAAQRYSLLLPHVGENVTFRTAAVSLRGKLESLTKSSAVVAGQRFLLPAVLDVRVHVGGDWVAAAPRGGTLDAKLNIRCHKATKAFIERGAKKKSQSTSEFALNATVAEAAALLNEKPPKL